MKYILIFFGIILGALFLTYYWFHYPDYFFIFPETFMLWLVSVSGSSSDEELIDIMLLLIFSISFIVASIVTLIGFKVIEKVNQARKTA